jgi:chromosome segregation ATPase
MTPTLIAVDRESVQHSFREWQAEQTLLDAQLAESVAALDAYQSHLDAWQQELARERDELRQLRAAIERDELNGGVPNEQLAQVAKELDDARQKITSLTAALLARTEELRDLDHQRGDANVELVRAKSREQELTAQLAAKQHTTELERHQWEKELAQLREQLQRATESPTAAADIHRGEPGRNCQSKSEPRTQASPVLGTVMEQFGKLRQQRSMNRPNQPKPR